MGSENTQKWIGRNRPPRVQITYDVEIGGAIEKRELPFVIGILSDLTPGAEGRKLQNSRFVEIDTDNFNAVLERFKPQAKFVVDDKTEASSTSKLAIDLSFRNMDDFRPLNVIEAIPKLKDLLEARRALVDLETKLYGNDALDEELRNLVGDGALLNAVREQLQIATPSQKPLSVADPSETQSQKADNSPDATTEQ